MTQQQLLSQIEAFLREQKNQLLPPACTFKDRRRWENFIRNLNTQIEDIGDKVAGF